MAHLFTLLVVSIAMTFLLIACLTLLIILIVHLCLMYDITLLLTDSPAPLLTTGIKHCPASCHRELIAVLHVAYILHIHIYYSASCNLLSAHVIKNL